MSMAADLPGRRNPWPLAAAGVLICLIGAAVGVGARVAFERERKPAQAGTVPAADKAAATEPARPRESLTISAIDLYRLCQFDPIGTQDKCRGRRVIVSGVVVAAGDGVVSMMGTEPTVSVGSIASAARRVQASVGQRPAVVECEGPELVKAMEGQTLKVECTLAELSSGVPKLTDCRVLERGGEETPERLKADDLIALCKADPAEADHLYKDKRIVVLGN